MSTERELSSGSPVTAAVRLRRVARRIAQDRILLLIGILVVLIAYMSIRYPDAFPHWDNITAVLLDAAQSGILTVGMMILLIAGVFDLSVGSTLAFGGIVAGTMVKVWGLPPAAAILGGILSGLLVGAINGLIVTRLRINALITTLATQYILRGVTQLVAPSGVANLPHGFRPFGQTMILGLQSPFWFMLMVVLVAWFAMSRVRYFRSFYYTGANARAARLSGINVDRVLLVGFALAGMLAGLAGTLLASRLSNAVVLAGVGTELRAITAAILGGASLTGGVGTILGAFLAVLFMALIQNALIIARVPVFWQSIVVGVVLLVALGVDQIGKDKR